MDYNKERIIEKLNDILDAQRTTLEIAKVLLECVFVSWNKPENIIGVKHILKFIIIDFYEILCEKQVEHFEELKDYSKNADEHYLIQKRIKKISEMELLLQKKEYHDEIIYLMDILS